MLEIQRVSKGFYQHSQINNFISVKNYIFVRKNGKKYLLLQFYNDLKHPVHEMEYTVIELDSEGKELGRTDVKRSNTVFHPSSTYISTEGVAVNEKCCDFKVVFKRVCANRYLYTVNAGLVNVNYIKKSDDTNGKVFSKYADTARVYSARSRRFGKPRLAAFFAILAILAIFGVNLYQIIASLLA